jgi:putative endonuclease
MMNPFVDAEEAGQEVTMATPRQVYGRRAEKIAVGYLRRHGYRIVETNYRNAIGEIDIIARDGGGVVFIEVKARKTLRFGSPKQAVTRQKQRKISMTALAYLKETGQLNKKARFDVVAVSGEGEGAAVELIRNAFEIAYDRL